MERNRDGPCGVGFELLGVLKGHLNAKTMKGSEWRLHVTNQ
jgi:hypothetical protein